MKTLMKDTQHLSRSLAIALEQVSHHPPISAFYISNKKDGFCISGSILAKSKFYGRECLFKVGNSEGYMERNKALP